MAGLRWYRCNGNKSTSTFRGGQGPCMQSQYHGLATRLLYGTQGTIGRKKRKGKTEKVHSQIQQEYEFCFIFFLLFHLSNTPAQKWKDRVVYGRIWLLLLHCIEFCTIFFFFFHHAYICNLPHPC